MKTFKIVITVVLVVIFLLAVTLFLIGFLKPKPGGILVDTNPISNVFINGNLVGKTPYTGTDMTGQVSLRLEPEDSKLGLLAYETKINLQPGIQTVVRRDFGASEEFSSGDIISFEKVNTSSTGLVIISVPDNSQVLIDGIVDGFSPYNSASVASGPHTITVSSPGFEDRTINIKTRQGYRLIAYVKLAKNKEENVSSSPSPTPQVSTKTFVVINDTPTGFLRMRTQPGTSGEEIAELKPGDKYPFLEEDAASGWFKIQYKESVPGLPNGIVGWVSNQYSQIATQSGELNN